MKEEHHIKFTTGSKQLGPIHELYSRASGTLKCPVEKIRRGVDVGHLVARIGRPNLFVDEE